MNKELLEKFGRDWNKMQYSRPADKRRFLPGFLEKRAATSGVVREPDPWYKRLLWGAMRFLRLKKTHTPILTAVGDILRSKDLSCTSAEMTGELRKLGYSDEEIEGVGVKMQ